MKFHDFRPNLPKILGFCQLWHPGVPLKNGNWEKGLYTAILYFILDLCSENEVSIFIFGEEILRASNFGISVFLLFLYATAKSGISTSPTTLAYIWNYANHVYMFYSALRWSIWTIFFLKLIYIL